MMTWDEAKQRADGSLHPRMPGEIPGGAALRAELDALESRMYEFAPERAAIEERLAEEIEEIDREEEHTEARIAELREILGEPNDEDDWDGDDECEDWSWPPLC